MPPPRPLLARRTKTIRLTAGNLTLNGTSWADVSGTEVILPAEAGDRISVSISARVGNEAVQLFLDPWTYISGSAGYAFSPGAVDVGNPGWVCDASVYSSVKGRASRVLTAAEIVNSQVTVRLRARTFPTATNKLLYATNGDLSLTLDVTNESAPLKVIDDAVKVEPPPPIGSGDSIPPSTPNGLYATIVPNGPDWYEVILHWHKSSDNEAINYYIVYRGGVRTGFLGLPNETGSDEETASDLDAEKSTTYSYTVQAVDFAGNRSAQSSPLLVTTPGPQLAPSPSYSHWKVTTSPSTYRSKAQTITWVNNPVPKSGQATQWSWFAACTQGWANGNGGYMGMQTDNNGKRVIVSVWDSTLAVATASGATATQFVEDGTGWHILWPYSWIAGHEYQFEIIESSTVHYWDFWLWDKTSGARTQIGYFRVPSTWGRLIATSHDNFVEWYSAPVSDCAKVPYSAVQFGEPSMRFDEPSPVRCPHTSNSYSGPCYSTVVDLVNLYTGHGIAEHRNGSQP